MRRLSAVGAALLLPLRALAGEATPAPAAAGTDLLRAAELATTTLAGTIRSPRQLDLHGWAAELEIERVLAGEAAGARARVAWEERATRRPPRFAEGDRVLLALEPLPPGSLWTRRFPTRNALAVAADGKAFLRWPDPRSLDLLERYLALPSVRRLEPPGVEALARLVAGADSALAAEALARLDAVPGLSKRLDEEARGTLAAALSDAERPLDLRVGLLDLVARARLAALRPAAQSLAEPGSPLEPEALAALAAIDGGLPAERARALLLRAEPAVRAVAARHGASPERLTVLLRSDPSTRVRLAAVETLVAIRGAAAIDTASPALFDPDPEVSAAAARAIGGLGAAAVPSLRALAVERAGPQAPGPLMALALAGPHGVAALRGIALEHPDAKVRRLALLALGELSEP